MGFTKPFEILRKQRGIGDPIFWINNGSNQDKVKFIHFRLTAICILHIASYFSPFQKDKIS